MAGKKNKPQKPKKPPTPKQPKPWDVPPPPAKGDPDIEIVYAAVGRALSDWEALEGAMASVFGGLVSDGWNDLPAQRAYGSVITFRGRSDMLLAANNAFFLHAPNDALHDTIENLVEMAGNFSARRNEIAHGRVRTYYQTNQLFFVLTRRGRVPSGYVLGAPDHATKKTKISPPRMVLQKAHYEPSYAYSSIEIEELKKHFKRLADDARKISLQLIQEKEKRQRQKS